MRPNSGRKVCTAGLGVLAGVFAAQANAQFGNPQGQLIAAPPCLTPGPIIRPGAMPCTPSTHRDWLAEQQHWRTERRIRVGYDGSRYDLPQLQWAQHSFIQPQMMVNDRYLYDPVTGKYTGDRYLDDLQKRYGGIDAVLVWPVYPNMGIDDRNQHDITRHARRHRGPEADGSGLPSSWRQGPVPHDDVGSGNERSQNGLAYCHRRVHEA